MTVKIMIGDALSQLKELDDDSLHCCITSPPYWGLRAYKGDPGMIGLEPTFEEHLENLVAVFREVRRVLRKDGTCWINYGDAYAGSWGNYHPTGKGGQRAKETKRWDRPAYEDKARRPPASRPQNGLKPKDLMMMPARVAMALQADGWWIRSEIIWHKCLSGGVWLYARTQKGVGPHMLKDLVRLDPSTIRLWNGTKWTQVVGWVQSPDRADPREIVLRSGERIGCTADHRWPTADRGLVETRDLVIGDILRSARLPDEGHEPKWLTPDALWFAGMYLAEGSMSGDTIQLSGHVKETERWRRIQALCEHYGAMPSLYENGNKQEIHINRCSALRAILRTVLAGRTAKDKRLSLQVWGWRNAVLKHIVMGYLEGDGSPDVGRVRLGCTRNYSLERDLRCLSARLGATITLKPSVSTIGNKGYPSFRGEWRWSRTGHHNERDRFEVMEIRRSRARKFWDVSVEDDPHLFALASGVLTHNSNPMPESATDRPTSAHEKLFLLTKAPRYFYDADAVRTEFSGETKALSFETMDFKRRDRYKMPDGRDTGSGAHGSVHRKGREKGKKADKQRGHSRRHDGFDDQWDSMTKEEQQSGGANLRNVWKIATHSFSEAHFACVDDETECLTAERWKRREALRVGDTIAGFDTETGRCRWDTVREIAAYPVADEPMIRILGRGIDQLLTPNHRCVIERRSGNRDIVRADMLKPSHKALVAAQWDDKSVADFPDPLASLIGWYVTEGNAGKDRITLYQSGDANPRYCDEIRQLLEDEGAVFTEASRVREWRGRDVIAVSWRVTGAIANMLLSLCPNKHLPDGFLRWPQESLEVLWDAMMKGDGHFRDAGRQTFVQKDKVLIDQVQALACRLGYATTMRKRSEGTWALYKTESLTRLLRSESGNLLSTQSYTGVVWCPRTDTGAWVARRDHRVFITGNTFPPALVEPCIKAGTSERGVCAECGAPWARVVKRTAGGLSLGLVELKQAAEKLVGMPPAFLPEELEGSQ